MGKEYSEIYLNQIKEIQKQFPLEKNRIGENYIEYPLPFAFFITLDSMGFEVRSSFEKNKELVVNYHNDRLNEYMSQKKQG